MKYTIQHNFNDWPHFYVSTFFNNLYDQLQKRYENHTFEIINYPEYDDYGYGSIYSCMNFSIINSKTEKYALVSFFDNWKYHFMKHIGWKPEKMVKFFYPGGFNYLDYYNWRKDTIWNDDVYCPLAITDIYKSLYYNTYSPENISYKYKTNSTSNKIIFRGWIWPFRDQMLSGVKDESIVVIEKRENNAEKTLSYDLYLKELSEHRCALSLPGGTEICNRDIECFAVGVPVIRPFINVSYEDPLIPNYHYISCFEDIKYWNGYPEHSSFENFGDRLIETWNRVRENYDYLEFISKNARLWYERNCTLENNLNYLLKNIELEELNG